VTYGAGGAIGGAVVLFAEVRCAALVDSLNEMAKARLEMPP